MDPQTFEQEEVSADLFGSAAAFLLPDITVTLNFAPDGKAVSGMWQDLISNTKESCPNDELSTFHPHPKLNRLPSTTAMRAYNCALPDADVSL